MDSPDAIPKLVAEDLHKSFGGKVVLDGIRFSVAAGESLAIVGPSGTGKSVLLKHLIGLIQPDSGRVLVDGQDLWALSGVERNTLRRKFGMSFQEGALFDSMTVFENVAFPLRRSGKSPAEIRSRVRECPRPCIWKGSTPRGRRSSRGACGGGWGSLGPSPTSRRSCSSMSPTRDSTRS